MEKSTGHDSRKKKIMEGKMGKWDLKGGREGEEGNGTKEKQILHGFSYMWYPGLKRVAWKMDGVRSTRCQV